MAALLTVNDLEQSTESLFPYLQRAKELKDIYLKYVATSVDDNYTYKVDVYGSKGRANGIHASESAGCWRPTVYSLMQTERQPSKEIDVNMLMRFNIGKAVHAMIQAEWHRIAEKSGGRIRFEDEVQINPSLQKVSEEWNLHSSCDGLITLCDLNGNPEVRVGLEIKTESDPQFKELKEPRPKHREQTNLYMAALDVPLMLVLYYNKSNSNITDSAYPWLYTFDKKLWEDKQLMRFAKQMYLASIGELPEKSEGIECGWCPYAWTCGPKVTGRVRAQTKAKKHVTARGLKVTR